MNDSYYSTYRVKSNSPLTALSFKFYNTIKLWWLIVLANNINNPVSFIPPGTTLKVIKPQFVPQILESIQAQLK
jgi:prophage DNA circulation protein